MDEIKKGFCMWCRRFFVHTAADEHNKICYDVLCPDCTRRARAGGLHDENTSGTFKIASLDEVLFGGDL